ncbi:uncharacterized protein LOC108919454 isoform X2 [Scleropages formosus]|uniref:uncharacterized protein LOC108919454 isoform X2 n=1 Tax=Scleropages formosus TaxID=113540 RepID=UPI0008789EEE|nr:uncharacterized protein LOC108919454 isoform X2 [Scleropages formosus]
MESMKPQEGELAIKISELQSMVSELKTVFSSALLELNQIKDSDTCLQEDLRETKQTCEKRTRHLEALVYSLKEELIEVRCQLLQLRCDQQKLQQSLKMSCIRGLGPQRNCCGCSMDREAHCDGLLLHCYLQGGCAGWHPHTGTFVIPNVPSRTAELTSAVTTSCGSDVPYASPCEGRRMQVTLELLHSEQEYVKTLNQLLEKYRMLSALEKEQDSHEKFLNYTEQLLRQHRLFRNELEDCLTRGHGLDRVADAFAKLMCQDESAFSEMYLGYLRTLPEIISALHKSDVAAYNTQASLGERKELLEVFPILAPVSQIHNYLIHTQSELQWTRRDHGDYDLLEERKRVLWQLLSRCHDLLEEASLGTLKEAAGCRSVSPHELHSARKNCSPADATHHLCVPHHVQHTFFPATANPDRKEGMSASGQGFLLRLKPSGEQACGQERPDIRENVADGDTDQEDFGNTSVFDYSSVTSCSPDGTYEMGAKAGEEGLGIPGRGNLSDGDTDSQVPVLLKPSHTPSSPLEHGTSAEASSCPRWQVPRVSQEHGVAKNISHSPSRTFRITWDESFKQGDSPPNECKKSGRQSASKLAQVGRYQRVVRQATLLGVPCGGPMRENTNGTSPWEESEDEGPCSTV